MFLGVGALSAQAQISAGTKLLTGSIGYSRKKLTSDNLNFSSQKLEAKNAAFDFNSSAGYLVADNLVIRVSVGTNLAETEFHTFMDAFNSPYTYQQAHLKQRNLSAGVFGRYYKFLGEKVALYGQLSAGYQNIFHSGDITDGLPTAVGTRDLGFNANLFPGIAFFPTKKIGVELMLRGATYDYLSNKTSNGAVKVKNTTSSFDLGLGLQDLKLGVLLYLGRN